jgi:hypothetical protein
MQPTDKGSNGRKGHSHLQAMPSRLAKAGFLANRHSKHTPYTEADEPAGQG